MPLKPVTGDLLLPLETCADVERLLAEAAACEALGHLDCDSPDFEEDAWDRARDRIRNLRDHFAYLAGARPELFEPLRADLLERPAELKGLLRVCGLSDLCTLYMGAEELEPRPALELHAADPQLEVYELLVALASPAALRALGELTRGAAEVRARLRHAGVEFRHGAPPRLRFTPERRVLHLYEAPEPRGDHPVGLPLREVTKSRGGLASWHYASLDRSHFPAIPWPGRALHLLGAPLNAGYTLYSSAPEGDLLSAELLVDERGRDLSGFLRWRPWLRYLPDLVADLALLFVGPSDVGLAEDISHELKWLEEQAAEARCGGLELRPYDEEHVYCNTHVFTSEGVVGVLGGPPAFGPIAPPTCFRCQRLMFHVLTVTHHVRSYGDGFRRLFSCEECRALATQATLWN